MSRKLFHRSEYELVSGKDRDIEKGEVTSSRSGSSTPTSSSGGGDGKNSLLKSKLSLLELLRVLSPYFWPSSGSDGAVINRIRSSSTWIMVAASKVSNLAAPFLLSYATNDVVAGRMSSAVRSMVLYAFLRFMSSVFRELQSILYIKVRQQASIELQEITFGHLLGLSLNWHLSKKTGSIMKSMDRGIEAANTLISTLFLYLLPAVAECLSVVILFFVQYRQWELGLLVFVGVTLYAVATYVITQHRKKYREQTNRHDNDYHDKATDSIINYETVKYFTNEKHEIQQFKDSVVQYQKYTSGNLLFINILNITQQFILNLTMLGTMVVAGYAVYRGQMTLGGWIAVQSWVTTIFAPLNYLGSVYSSIFQALIDIRNLSELLAEAPDIVDSPGAIDLPLTQQRSADTPVYTKFTLYDEPESTFGVAVEFRDVSFHYPEQPKEKGLKNVSFLVRPGTTTAIVGHTGSGKTTISRLLFRFYDPDSGSVLVNNHDIKNCTQGSVRRAIGIVPQDTVLFNSSFKHNIGYGQLDCSEEDIKRVAEAAQIRKFIESLPAGYGTVVGERGLKLSGGEKQRVAIARCLLKNPPVVVLDEATSALDTITESSIQEALRTLGENRTVIVIAHRLSTIRNADQIVVMDNGEVAEIGSHEELLSKESSHYSSLWSMQLAAAMNTQHSSSANLDEAAV